MKAKATSSNIKKRPPKKIPGSSKSLVKVPTSNKTRAIDARKKILLEEYANRYKSSAFIDRRFGENDNTMSVEDKIFERFTKETQRKLNRSARSFLDPSIHADHDDSDNDHHGGFQLTHGGKSLSQHLDKKDNSDISDFEDLSDNEKGHIDRETVSASHFGGFDAPSSTPNDDKKKTKAEVMKEVIAKSKYYKYERQKAKEENEEMRNELNLEFDAIRSSLLLENSNQKTQQPKSEMENATLDFDSIVKSLALEGKRAAKAVDRVKTPLELAQEEKEKLEHLESERLARMRGDHDEESRSDQEESTRQASTFSNADSDEDEDEDEEADNDTDADSISDADFENESISESEQQLPESDDMSTNFLFNTRIAFECQNVTGSSATATKELPFAFSCPQTLTEWHTLIQDCSSSEIFILLDRTRKLFPIGLDASHKIKLQNLVISLFQHVLYIAATNGVQLFADAPLKKYVNDLMQFIETVLRDLPSSETIVKDWFIEKLLAQLSQYQQALQVTLPSSAMLTLYTLIGRIYSTSDFRHAVVTPTILLMAMTLSQSKIESKSDLVKGLYLTALYYDYQKEAKRYLPEAMSFLAWTLDLLSQGSKKKAHSDVSSHFAYPTRTTSLQLSLNKSSSKEWNMVCPSLESVLTEEDVSVEQILAWTLSLIEKSAAQAWDAESPAFIEIYEPFYMTLHTLMGQIDSVSLKERVRSLSDKFNSKLKESQGSRQPLKLQEFAPASLPLLNPRLDHRPEYDGSAPRRRGETRSINQDGEEEIQASEYQRLQKAFKREKKGAIRELRKDAHVLNSAKSKMQLQARKNKKRTTVLH